MTAIPLYKQIANILRDKIAAGEFSETDRLPSEPHLAQELGVARTTLREALYLLEEENLILRKKGVGSFINPHAGQVPAGIEKLQSYTKFLTQRGYETKEKLLSVRDIKIQPLVAAKLKVPDDFSGYMVESLYLVNGCPAIYCCDIVPHWLLKESCFLEKIDCGGSLMECLQEACHIDIHYTTQRVQIILADSPVSDILEVPSGTPLLQMKGFAYDGQDCPLYMLNNYFKSDLIEFTIIRRK